MPDRAAARILLGHNRYQQPGGEDAVLEAESALLVARGHDVVRYEVHNRHVDGMRRLRLLATTLWNREAARTVRALHAAHGFTVAHFHNTFPLLSPAVYAAAGRCGAAVVQTLHNFRLLCPNAYLMRDGQPCEACLSRPLAWPGIRHACYRGSRSATAVTAGMVATHRLLGTWHRRVDLYLALSEFSRQKFIAGGLPAERITVLPNFLPHDPGVSAGPRSGVLYVGRLSAEKGVRVLVDAVARLAAAQRPVDLTVIGTGPLEPLLARVPAGVRWLGLQPRAAVLRHMQAAAVLVLPSTCYENCPMTLVEASAVGLPAIVSGHGAMAEMVEDGHTGWHAVPGDVESLAAVMDRVRTQPARVALMGAAARRAFEARYTADRHYAALRKAYATAASRRAALGIRPPDQTTPAAA